MSEHPYFRDRDLYVPGAQEFKGSQRTGVLRSQFVPVNGGKNVDLTESLLALKPDEDLFELGSNFVVGLDQIPTELRDKVMVSLLSNVGALKVRRLTADFHAWLNTCLQSNAEFAGRLAQKPVGVVFSGDPKDADLNLVIPFGRHLKPEQPLLIAKRDWVRDL